MKPILLIDCYLDPCGGAKNFLPWLESRPVHVVRPAHEPVEIDPDDYSAAILTGSGASSCSLPDWAERIVGTVRGFAARNQPMLGVCFGHQILARALVGEHVVRPAAHPEVGWIDVTVTADDPLLDGLGSGFRVFASHVEEVTASAGKSMRVLAETPQCHNQAYHLAGLPVWGVQFHAEMGYDEARELVHAKAARYPELGLVPEIVLARACDGHPIFQRIMNNFLAAL